MEEHQLEHQDPAHGGKQQAESGGASSSKLRLPKFFPLTVPQCESETSAFFQCFEEHSKMKHDTDVASAKASLGICEDSLKAYTVCTEKHINKKAKGKFLGIF